MSYTTDAARWRALATRDANANGHFFYSVKSTQIYCRPTCPARLARRANISFQKTIAEAEALGFRACKRCKPNVENEDPQDKAVAKACSFIEEAARKGEEKSLKLHVLAKKVGLTPRYLHKIFKDKTGTTPREYTNIVAAQHSSSSATPGSDWSPSNVETFDWDNFDVSDLANYQFDLSTMPSHDYMEQTAQMSASSFAMAPGDWPTLQPWVGRSCDLDNSDVDSALSYEQQSAFSELNTAMIDFAQYHTIKPTPMDPALAFDIEMAMLLQSDLASTNFPLSISQDLSASNMPITPDRSSRPCNSNVDTACIARVVNM